MFKTFQMFKMIVETIHYYNQRPKPGRWFRESTPGRLVPSQERREMYARIQRARFRNGRNLAVFRVVFLSIMWLRTSARRLGFKVR